MSLILFPLRQQSVIQVTVLLSTVYPGAGAVSIIYIQIHEKSIYNNIAIKLTLLTKIGIMKR